MGHEWSSFFASVLITNRPFWYREHAHFERTKGRQHTGPVIQNAV